MPGIEPVTCISLSTSAVISDKSSSIPSFSSNSSMTDNILSKIFYGLIS